MYIDLLISQRSFYRVRHRRLKARAAPQCREEVLGWGEQKALCIGCYRILWVSFDTPRYPDQSKEN